MKKDLTHKKFCDSLLYAFGSLPHVRIWPREVGAGVSVYDGIIRRYGVRGESDLQGIVAPWGRLLSIEAKTYNGRLSPHQITYRDMIVRFGGIWILAYAEDDRDLRAGTERALEEFKKCLRFPTMKSVS